jgi:hypothetical protein
MRSYCDVNHPRGRQTIQELIATGIWGKVCLLKWAAGCSLIQSPNDVGKTHFILRNFIKWQNKKGATKTVALKFNECGAGLKAHYLYLHSADIAITAARKRGFWRLLSNLPTAAAEAFRERVVKASWTLCGYYPLNYFMILEKCTLWKKRAEDGGLTDDEKRLVFASIRSLQETAYNHGRVSDLEMLQVLPFLSRYPTSLKHDLADLAINRDRCCLVIHESYLEERTRASLAARASDPSLKAPKRARVKQQRVWNGKRGRHNHTDALSRTSKSNLACAAWHSGAQKTRVRCSHFGRRIVYCPISAQLWSFALLLSFYLLCNRGRWKGCGQNKMLYLQLHLDGNK